MASESSAQAIAPQVPIDVLLLFGHNNQGMSHAGNYSSQEFPTGVMQNGCVFAYECDGVHSLVKNITDDSKESRFVTQAMVKKLFPGPVPFPTAGPIIVLTVRHGQTTQNAGGSCGNPVLTEQGKIDALKAAATIRNYLGEDLTRYSFTVAVSPLTRANQTKEIVLEALGIKQIAGADVRLTESVRYLKQPVQPRGEDAPEEVVVACNPNLLPDAYRLPGVCPPEASDAEIEDLALANRIPNWQDFPNNDNTLLAEQLANPDWPIIVATATLDQIVRDHMAKRR
jgi:phosphohistidine phosphatase SixA